MFRAKRTPAWDLIPATRNEIEAARKKCRRRIARHAAVSAGVSMMPVPGIDIAVDAVLLAKLIREAHIEFGLSPKQIERFLPEWRTVTRAMFGDDGVLAVHSVMRALLVQLLKRNGAGFVAASGARMIPLARQIASAAFNYAAFRAIALRHIEECARAAEEMIDLQARPVQ